MSHEPFSELAAAYALGALDGDERSRFEAHLRAGCRECETALVDYGETLAAVTAELPPVGPPPGVKAALLERIAAQTPRAPAPRAQPQRVSELPRPRWIAWRWAFAGALAASLVVNLFLGVRMTRISRELAARSEEGFKIREQLVQMQELLEIARKPGNQVVALAGLKPSPGAEGTMYWRRGGGGIFLAGGLPPPPSGKTYQLWAIAGGKPVSAGVFGVDPSGSGTLRVSPLAGVPKVDLFAVTLEPAGGLPQPSGEMYLASK